MEAHFYINFFVEKPQMTDVTQILSPHYKSKTSQCFISFLDFPL